MTKRRMAACAGYGTALAAALVVMRDANQSNEKIEATRPAIEAAIPIRNGDVNGDGRIELDDILLVMRAFSSPDECPPPCLEDICCCGPHVVELDDLLAVLLASSGETVFCPPVECVEPEVRIHVECENADGVLVPIERNADGEYTVFEGQRCEYSAVPAAEPGE